MVQPITSLHRKTCVKPTADPNTGHFDIHTKNVNGMTFNYIPELMLITAALLQLIAIPGANSAAFRRYGRNVYKSTICLIN